jgi:Leucine-rich repeat (LRR) protein
VTLKLAGNELLSFPNDRIDVLGSLLYLDVSGNHIDHFPTDFPYLYRVCEVRASGNDLEDLPREIVKMHGLVFLDVSDNIIASLPETIGKLPALKHLNVSDNKIMQFPKVSYCGNIINNILVLNLFLTLVICRRTSSCFPSKSKDRSLIC